jgi:hypothetical protein
MIHDIPFETPAASPYSTDELRRFDGDTRAKLSLAMNALAGRTVERLRTQATDATQDNAALLADLKHDLQRAATELEGREGIRGTCDLLRLYRVCPRAACRRAQTCAGDGRCAHGIAVPAPVLDRVAWMLLAERVPWVTSHAREKLAYDCWVAGIEAGSSDRTHPTRSGAQMLQPEAARL